MEQQNFGILRGMSFVSSHLDYTSLDSFGKSGVLVVYDGLGRKSMLSDGCHDCEQIIEHHCAVRFAEKSAF